MGGRLLGVGVAGGAGGGPAVGWVAGAYSRFIGGGGRMGEGVWSGFEGALAGGARVVDGRCVLIIVVFVLVVSLPLGHGLG